MDKEIGLIGLGKMGKGLAQNLMRNGYRVIASNRSREPLEEIAGKGAVKAQTVEDLVSKLKPRRLVWVMLTAGEPTISMINQLAEKLDSGDIVIDGSNSNYKDSMNMYDTLKEKGIKLVDAGCSGGPSGALNGLSTMYGGDADVCKELEPLFKSISVENGSLYTGPAGSGHFVKMVHNAIEYGMMQSIAEGLELIEMGPYKDLNLAAICDLWDNGSVIRGYLIELASRALKKDRHLSGIEPYVNDTGEGRWSIEAAIEHDVPFSVISQSLFERFRSRSEVRFGNRMLAALRHEFGGHDIKEAK
ncbi:MAG: decarboxylating 6-phosphogluconate dehydrogenase [Candidatus Micrarchaeota archaeon]|nr:decarboxylating 6-phosphogluconate dehydrogenase [Candidatus Micrarchaeota archaeon]